MMNVYCTECRGIINLGAHTRKGQIIYCNKCGARMVVMNLSPVELEWLFNDGYEDWPKHDLDYKDLDRWI